MGDRTQRLKGKANEAAGKAKGAVGYKTGSVPRIEAHPVRLARDLDLDYSINTDDPGAFECSMTSEYRLLEETFGFQADDFTKILRNSLAARFQPHLRYPERSTHL